MNNENLIFKPSSWNLESIFSDINTNSFKLSPNQKTEYESIFWHSLCTEYDSQNLYKHLLSNSHKLNLSKDFMSFLQVWLKDEVKHADGFIILYSLLYGIPKEEILHRLKQRSIYFDDVQKFLNSEQSILLLLAYDEIVTSHVYHRAESFYQTLGPQQMLTWIQRLKKDEVVHFNNTIKILKKHFKDQVSKVDTILHDILETDKNMQGYGGTFVLDHACHDFSLNNEELESLCSKLIIKKLTPLPLRNEFL